MKSFFEWYIKFKLRNRVYLLAGIVIITGFFCYRIAGLKIETDFFSLYPPKHPYIQLYNKYRNMFGSANVLVCAVEVKKGDIYNLETIKKIDRITQEVIKIDGCNSMQVVSITHPRLKNIQVDSWGISIRPLMWPTIPQNDADIDKMKQGIYSNEGIRGFYVSPDDKSAAIYAGFWEENVDPIKTYASLMALKAKESDANTNIYFTGYPALYAYIYHLAPQIYIVFVGTVVLLILLLYFYFRTWQGVLVPSLSVVVSAIWGLGFASLFGFPLDPLVMVIPILMSATALSHSVQYINRYHQEYEKHGERIKSIEMTSLGIFGPATTAIITEGVGVMTIAVASIPLMQKLAWFCSFWVISILVSVVTLNPLVLSFIRPPDKVHIDREYRGRFFAYLSKMILFPSRDKVRWITMIVVVILFAIGLSYSIQLKVGDTEAGKALLYPDHPYNVASKVFNEKFLGSNQMVIIAEGKKEGVIKDPKILMAMEKFQRWMEVEGGATGTLTFTNMIKRIYRMFHEGNPKWETIPDNPKHLGQIGFQIAASTSPGEMDRWVDSTWTNATITCFYKDYNNESIARSLDQAKVFIKNNPVENVRFRLAGGLLGVLAAVNEEVEKSYWKVLFVVLTVVFLLASLQFRSFIAGFILLIPLALSQVISEMFMFLRGIDLNINSLPISSAAIGIGVNYGIYLMARISEEMQTTGDYNEANTRAMATTGKAIIFTATTLIVGVIFWFFVDLKFQAEMGLLLGLLMFLNMFSALILIPTLVRIFKPKFVSERRV